MAFASWQAFSTRLSSAERFLLRSRRAANFGSVSRSISTVIGDARYLVHLQPRLGGTVTAIAIHPTSA